MDLFTAIKERKSVRKFRPDPIPAELLRDLFEVARWAPSWANTQCWEVIVVSNPETRDRLAETVPPGNPARDSIGQAPLVIVACARLEKAGYYKGTPATDKGDWCMFDVALFMHTLTLAAHARGLGTVHIGLFDARAVAGILEVPAGVAVIELLPLGYPDGEPSRTSRKEVRDFVSYGQYGSR
jgi:nitroreductase